MMLCRCWGMCRQRLILYGRISAVQTTTHRTFQTARLLLRNVHLRRGSVHLRRGSVHLRRGSVQALRSTHPAVSPGRETGFQVWNSSLKFSSLEVCSSLPMYWSFEGAESQTAELSISADASVSQALPPLGGARPGW
eukprot:363701-Chlamydomonas_euryale.AAC.5